MRLQHVAGIAARKQMFSEHKYNPAYNFVVRDLSENGDGSGPYEVIDGAHRFTAATQLVEELGMEKFLTLIPKTGLSAMVLDKHTPPHVLVMWANNQNDKNSEFLADSFIDRVFSTWKFLKYYTQGSICNKGRYADDFGFRQTKTNYKGDLFEQV